MRLIAAPLAAVLATGFGTLLASPASAHTPDISATCDGVRVGATAYDGNLANRWSVTIGGVTQTGTFGDSLDQTFPVPQDGATTTWSAFVEAADGAYHQDASGVVGPCGTPPDVERSDAGELSGCDVSLAGTTYGAGDLTYDEVYTDTYVFNASTNTWDLVTDTEPTLANVVFSPWTVAQQVSNDCVEKAAQPHAEQYGDSSTRLGLRRRRADHDHGHNARAVRLRGRHQHLGGRRADRAHDHRGVARPAGRLRGRRRERHAHQRRQQPHAVGPRRFRPPWPPG